MSRIVITLLISALTLVLITDALPSAETVPQTRVLLNKVKCFYRGHRVKAVVKKGRLLLQTTIGVHKKDNVTLARRTKECEIGPLNITLTRQDGSTRSVRLGPVDRTGGLCPLVQGVELPNSEREEDGEPIRAIRFTNTRTLGKGRKSAQFRTNVFCPLDNGTLTLPGGDEWDVRTNLAKWLVFIEKPEGCSEGICSRDISNITISFVAHCRTNVIRRRRMNDGKCRRNNVCFDTGSGSSVIAPLKIKKDGKDEEIRENDIDMKEMTDDDGVMKNVITVTLPNDFNKRLIYDPVIYVPDDEYVDEDDSDLEKEGDGSGATTLTMAFHLISLALFIAMGLSV